YFLDKQADELAEHPEQLITEDVEIEEGTLEPAELPDWLSDLKPQATTPDPAQSIDAIFETPAATEMPDWLRQDVLGGAETSDLENIFAEADEDSRPLAPIIAGGVVASAIDVDTSDPWVEAFDEEYTQGGMADVNAVPEWYEQNVNDPARIA